MVVLTESSLNKRHHEFNRKLAEAVANNVNFDDVKAEGNESDIDYLFMIDLASKYKNIDYILEALKSGDSLRISRALKCTWMFDSEYCHIINPQFINDNIFPHLSVKSKKKLMNTISVYVRDEKRLLEFYEFCKSHKYNDIALKFLLFTSEETKIYYLDKNLLFIKACNLKYCRHFIGNSLNLAKKYLDNVRSYQLNQILSELRYLYSDPDIGSKYLDLIETYIEPPTSYLNFYFKKFGLRMSKDIILKHKDRIYSKPLLYISLLNKYMCFKYSTVEDAKYYTTALMPDDAKTFWSVNYYENKKHFFDIIPTEERYQFIKKIFNDKYPGAPFEITIDFYKLKYYDLILDLELKEKLALNHIASGKQILGPGKDYLWYRFIKFDKSFEQVKKYIKFNSDPDIRAQIVNVLVESARNDRELETLFKYYYERHINEKKQQKEFFLDAVDKCHNIYRFDADCFAALDKIYFSVDIYNVLAAPRDARTEYQFICLIYRIINNMEMPEALVKFMDSSLPFYILHRFNKNLLPDQESAVVGYLMKFCFKKINSFDDKPYDDTVKDVIRKYIKYLLGLMDKYNKPKEDIPEFVMKYVYLDWIEFESHFKTTTTAETTTYEPFTQNKLLRCIKRNTSEFFSKMPQLKASLNYSAFRLNRVVRKLRVYFSNDHAVKFFKFYLSILRGPNVDKRTIEVVVYGIIHLADKTYLEEFMTKHAPIDPKIDHVNIDRKLLNIQSAICSLAGYARPPVPLPLILKYLKGDYIQYCLPLFSMYQVNLQPKLCIKFIISILDTPLSVQKHGIRLAFKFFSLNDLCNVVTEAWRRTKNVSLRFYIYKALHAKILGDASNAASLFEILNRFTSTIYQEDDPELFRIVTSDTLPIIFRKEHLKTVWDTYSKLPLKNPFIYYRANAINCIENNISNIEQEFIELIVKDHIKNVFDASKDISIYNKLREGGVIKAKWRLTAKYLTYVNDEECLGEKLNLAKSVTSICIKNWNVEIDGVKTYRNLFLKFLNMLKEKSFVHEFNSYRHVNELLQSILTEVIEGLPIEEIYQITLDLKLNISTRDIIIDGIQKRTDDNIEQIIKEAAIKFSKVCVNLVNDYIEKNQFWIMVCEDIKKIIMSEAQNLLDKLDRYLLIVKDSDILVLVCNYLIELKRFEALFLVLEMLQTPYEDGVFVAEYRNVLDKLQMFDDPQIKSYVYHKFNTNSERNTFI